MPDADDGRAAAHGDVVGVRDGVAAVLSHCAALHRRIGCEHDDLDVMHTTGRGHDSAACRRVQRARGTLVAQPVDALPRIARIARTRNAELAAGFEQCHQTALKARVTLWPPNPKELDSAAAPAGSWRGDIRTTSSATSSSGSSRLRVAGTSRLASDNTVTTASSAPAAPSRWPVHDFVAVTHTCDAESPNAVRRADASATSPSGVDVACALTCAMSDGLSPASRMARDNARAAPAPVGSGAATWYASALMPAPASVA